MKQNKFNKYCVYGLLVNANNQNFIYIGSGDELEPARRKYDFKKMHCISNKIAHNTKNGNYWKITPVVIYRDLTKNDALLIENELIGILHGVPQCLNSNKAVKCSEWATKEQLQYIRAKTVDALRTAGFVAALDKNPLYEILGLNNSVIDFYKTIIEILELKATKI